MAAPHGFTTSNSFTKGVYRSAYPAIDPKSPKLSQAGKVVLITGASRGIGRRGLADAFAQAGAKAIIITARKVADLKETEANIKAANPATEVLPLALEITKPESVVAAFAAIKAKFGRVDTLVNNAGFYDQSPVADTDPAAWWNVLQVNVYGTMLVTHHFLAALGKDQPGHVITLSSGAGLVSIPGGSAYSISKLADLRLSSFIAVENPNVTAVAVHPGIVLTDMIVDFFRPYAHDAPELVGGVVLWATTPEAKFLSGRYISSNWDVTEILSRKDEIVENDLLTVGLKGINGQEAQLLG